MRLARKPLWPAIAALAVTLGCNCGQPPSPSPVALVATNTLGFDIFVPDDQGQLGLSVGQGDGDSFAAISEGPACACQRCESACEQPACECAQTATAHRIRPGASVRRTFAATEFPATRADCGAGDLGPVCFNEGEPLPAGTYALQLCYATNAPGADQGQDEFATTFGPGSLTCITEQFAYPDAAEWDIAPPEPTPCDAQNACPVGQLCQQGACSASCLSNAVPPLGSSWTVSATVALDAAFFSRSGNRLTGSGTVGAVSFDQSVLDLPLRRDADHAQAEVFVALPPTVDALPLVPGEAVSVVVIAQTDDPESPSAIAIRDGAGTLLLAAELDPGTPVLTAADLAPLSVDPGGTPFACDTSNLCGRRLDSTMFFGLSSARTEVEPGKTVSLAAAGQSWSATALANSALPDTAPDYQECAPRTAFGYVIAADRQL